MSHLPANWLPPDPPQSPRRRRNSIIPALITVGCAFVLLGGSAFGALSTCSYSGNNRWFYTGLLFVGLFLLTLLFAAVYLIVRLFQKATSR